MDNTHLYSIETLLDNVFIKYAPIMQLRQKSIMLLKINQIVTSMLPIPIRFYCRVINIRNNILILETINASWKIRLYHEQTHLLNKLRTNILPSISTIKIKINPNLIRKLNIENNNYQYKYGLYHRQKPKQLSIKSAILIKNIANLCNKGQLYDALIRLAKLAI